MRLLWCVTWDHGYPSVQLCNQGVTTTSWRHGVQSREYRASNCTPIVRIWSTRIGGIRTPRLYTGKMAHAHSGPGTLRCASHRGQKPSHERQNGLQKARREGNAEGRGKVGGGHLKTGRHKYCEPVKPSEETRACNIEATPGNCVRDEAQTAETSEVVG